LPAKAEALSESPECCKQKVKAKEHNRAVGYELALQSGRDFRTGDRIPYYVTGKVKKVRAFEQRKFASAYNPAHPDENVPY
jgi:hypothetical protein